MVKFKKKCKQKNDSIFTHLRSVYTSDENSLIEATAATTNSYIVGMQL